MTSLAAALALALPQSAPAPNPDARARYEEVLRGLQAEDPQEREAADRRLAELPSEALALAEGTLARTDLDPELRWRLERVLPRLRTRRWRSELGRRKAADFAATKEELLEAYEAGGHRDPRWDEAAREALVLAARLWSGTATGPAFGTEAYRRTREAMEAGCADPMVLYVHARMYDLVVRKDAAESARLHVAAARRMKEAGGYPALRQAFAYVRAADFLGYTGKRTAAADREELSQWLELALRHTDAAARQEAVPDRLLVELGRLLVEAWYRLVRNRGVGCDRVCAVLEQARPGSPAHLLVRGEASTDWAWDARGGGWADSVTEQGWAKFRERLRIAEAALTRAWEMDPSDPAAPTAMLRVELGQGKGREVMELWYERAMKANPDNADACGHKLHYLEPKWHGSLGAMVDFGRELLRQGNWEARLPFILVEAHTRSVGYLKDPAYMHRAEVWPDIRAVYEGYLERFPDKDYDRSVYARLACACGQFAEARRQFERLGDRLQPAAFKDAAEIERLKAAAAARGR